jgi:hypothetical protein
MLPLRLLKPAYPSRLLATKEYIIDSFPEHYVLFDHTKGARSGPRHDLYLHGMQSVYYFSTAQLSLCYGLLGSRTVTKFRSTNEFLPHARWIYQNDPSATCNCKYCGKNRSQTAITASLGAFGAIKAQGGSKGIASRSAAVRRVAAVVKGTSLPRPILNRDRNSDLTSKRYLRQAEIVWCHLEEPIVPDGLQADDDASILFWPAVIMEPRFQVHIVPHEPGQPYAVTQSFAHKIKLLGVMHSYIVPEEELLPYQAYIPKDQILEELRKYKFAPSSTDLAELYEFQPMPSPLIEPSHILDDNDPTPIHPRPYAEAAAPFALAIQIAAQVSAFWCPTDQWKFYYGAPATTAPTSNKEKPAGTSSTLEGDPLAFHMPLDPPSSASTRPQTPETRSRSAFECRYQGLWWGGERIWMGDLVRIKPLRTMLHPDTTSRLLEEIDPMSCTRCLFLRIHAIFVEDGPPKPDGSVLIECRISGMLYETVPPDMPDETDKKGKGKEVEKAASSRGPLSSPQRIDSPARRSSPLAASSSRPSTPSKGLKETLSSSQSNLANVLADPFSSPAHIHSSDSTSEQWPYSMPAPPTDYKFRALLQPSHEIVLPLDQLAGRYYPPPIMLENPLMGRVYVSREFLEAYQDSPEYHEVQHIFSLGGILPGYECVMDCKAFRGGGRRGMMAEGDRSARQLLYDYWTQEPETEMLDGEEPNDLMDVDVEVIDLSTP